MKRGNIKRLLVVAILTITMMLSFTSCGAQMQTEEEVSKNNGMKYSMFIELEVGSSYKVVYHKDTKVMYAISCGYYNCGTFTVMLNADGTPMVYEGK